MALIDLLAGAGVTPIREPFSLDYLLYTPAKPWQPGFDPGEGGQPLVSCLMATSGERPSIRFALECYQRQLHPAREMVIVTYLDRVQAVQALVEEMVIANAAVHGVSRDLTLGEMRNVTVGRSNGHILIQWDDDDLYDPARITAAIAFLTSSPVAATLLSRVLIWWPARRLAAISLGRMWEASVAVWRAQAPVYPSLNRMEDTHAIHNLTSTRPVVACDLPLLYVYVAHGGNTCEDDHFEGHLTEATCALRGDEYEELMGMLAQRMPIRAYEAALGISAPA